MYRTKSMTFTTGASESDCFFFFGFILLIVSVLGLFCLTQKRQGVQS